MLLILYVLSIYIFFSICELVSVYYYKNSKKRKENKQRILTIKWKVFINSIVSVKFMSSYKVNEKILKELYKEEELIAFFTASQSYLNSEQPDVKMNFQRFIYENNEFWIKLGLNYSKKEFIKKAYFAFLCEKLFILNNKENYKFKKLMMDFVVLPSVYCRENALKAIYATGDKYAVITAFTRLSKMNIQHNHKLVTDGLLNFKGNKEELAEDLYNCLDKFNIEYQVAFINFFRFEGENLKYKLKDLFIKNTNKEMVCSLLRYYRKYPVPEYKYIILTWLNPPYETDWECISTAVSALDKYPGIDTVNALKDKLSSKYWYVRQNAASSLSELGAQSFMLSSILNGSDQYAKEALIYQLDKKGDD